MSQTGNITFSERIQEIGMFFQGTDRVHRTMCRVFGVMQHDPTAA